MKIADRVTHWLVSSVPQALLILALPIVVLAGNRPAPATAVRAPGLTANGARLSQAQPGPDVCTTALDKTADPGRVRLGAQVTVTLKVNGSCPSRDQQAEVYLVMDSSTSMGQNGKIDAAKRAAVTFVQRMDPALVRVGLITFTSAPVVAQPLTNDQSALIQAIQAIAVSPGTNLVDALDRARQDLTAPGVRFGAKKVIVFVTDGRHRVQQPPLSALDQVIADVGAAGIEVFTIGLGSDVDVAVLTRMATSPSHFFFSPTAADLESILVRISGYVRAQVLFDQAQVTDKVPANVDYIRGSGAPLEPTVSPDGKSLTWNLTSVREPGFELNYRLQPREVGRWPTNVEAALDYTDGYGNTDRQLFPIPTVEVFDDSPPQPGSCVCQVILDRVPRDVIDEILAHPESAYGWQYPLDEGKPPSPANPPRECLTLQNVNVDYHPLWNKPLWRVGCP